MKECVKFVRKCRVLLAVTRLLCINGNVAFKDDRVSLNLVLVNCNGFDHFILNYLINTVAMVYTMRAHR